MTGKCLYVIIVSEHNVAELRACLHLKPIRIWLIVTQRMRKQAARLRCVLAIKLPDSQIFSFESGGN